jgi:hypothetical protein
VYTVLGLAYYTWLFARRGQVAPEVWHDAAFNPLPGLLGGLCALLLWVFWGEQIEAWKSRMRMRLRQGRFSFLATELRTAGKTPSMVEKEAGMVEPEITR